MASDTSPVSICNLALSALGEARIAALDEETVAAGLCVVNYHPARRALLRRFPWAFARARAALTLAGTPAFEWAYSHTLPANFLRLLRLANSAETDVDRFTIEAGLVLSDEADLFLLYVSNQDDPTTFDDLFVDALAASLAARMAVPLTGDPERRKAAIDEFERLTLPVAQLHGALEDQSNENHPLCKVIGRSVLVAQHSAFSDDL